MPLKRKLTPVPDSNTLVIQPLNTSGSNTDKTTKKTPVESELLFKL